MSDTPDGIFLPALALQSHTGEEMPMVWCSDLGDPSDLLVPFTLSGLLLICTAVCSHGILLGVNHTLFGVENH